VTASDLAAPDAQIAQIRDVARRRLWGAGAVLASGLILSAVYATTGLGLACPMQMLTGWSCPLCGGTRMGSALLHLDLAAAAAYHPLALAGLVVGTLLALGWVVQLVQGRVPRAMTWVTGRLALVPSQVWWVVGTSVVIGYAVFRNLVWPIPA
jgi:hypothetical protein